MAHAASTSRDEEKVGITWLLIGLVVGIALTCFLMRVDDALTFSTRDKVLGETLRELRTGQTSIPSRSVDPRILVGGGMAD